MTLPATRATRTIVFFVGADCNATLTADAMPATMGTPVELQFSTPHRHARSRPCASPM